MRQVASIALAALLAAGRGSAETEVRRSGDKVDLRATAAPLSEVLDRLAKETGMKVSYDGPPPRARVTLSLAGMTPAQAVTSLLEGQGLNYALRMDPTGKRVETLLLVAGGSAAAAMPPGGPAPRPEMPSRPQREPEPVEAEDDGPEPAVPEAAEEQRKPNPFQPFGAPAGPAVPLMLPTAPPPPGPTSPTAASPAPPTPQD